MKQDSSEGKNQLIRDILPALREVRDKLGKLRDLVEKPAPAE